MDLFYKYIPPTSRMVIDPSKKSILGICCSADYLNGTLTYEKDGVLFELPIKKQNVSWDFCDDYTYLETQGYIGIVLNVPGEQNSISARHLLVYKFYKGELNDDACIQYILERDQDMYEIVRHKAGPHFDNYETLEQKSTDDFALFV